MSKSDFIEQVCLGSGYDLDQVRAIATTTLRALHKASVCNEESLWGVMRDCIFAFGEEAAYHLGGILEEYRTHSDHEIPWSEFWLRINTDIGEKFGPMLENWMKDRTENLKLLDES
jgi:hypothetical protein